MTTQEIDPTLSLGWTFGDRLRKVRRAAGLGQGEFADLLGVKVKAYGAWEAGSNEPRFDTMRRVALILRARYGVPVDWTLGLDEDLPDPDGPPAGGQSEPVTRATALDELKARKRSRGGGITTDREFEDYLEWTVAA